MTPPIDFDTEEEFEEEGEDDTIDIPCFRIVVIRTKILVSGSGSDESCSEDSEPETE